MEGRRIARIRKRAALPIMSNSDVDNDLSSPSRNRRQRLKAADVANTLRVLESYPLSKYFDIAQRLLDSFQAAVDDRHLDHAYIYGLRFANLAIELLPQHPEWKHNTQSRSVLKQKRKLAQQVDAVLSMMETIKQRMDVEELVRIQENKKRSEDQERKVNEELLRERAIEARQLQALEEQRRQHQREREAELSTSVMGTIPAETTPVMTATCNTVKSASSRTRSGKNMEEIEQSAMAKLSALRPPSLRENAGPKVGIADSSSALEGLETKVASKYRKKSPKPLQQQQHSHSIAAKPPAPQEHTEGVGTANPATVAKVASFGNRMSRRVDLNFTSRKKPSLCKDDGTASNGTEKLDHSTSGEIPPNVKGPAQPQQRQSLSSFSGTPIDSTRSLNEEEQDNARKTKTIVPTANNRLSKRSEGAVSSVVGPTSAPLSSMSIRMFASSEGAIETVDVATTTIPPPTSAPPPKANQYGHLSCSKDSNPSSRSHRRCKEQKTIDLLERTIALQEKRLADIETVEIPSLLHQAKDYLRNNTSVKGDNKKKALECVAKKRTLERQVDVIKAAIFNMETQMFMLENIMEDRHVQKALAEAAEVMRNIHQGARVDVVGGLDLLEIGSMVPPVMEQVDDDELMEELQDWLSPAPAKTTERAERDDEGLAMVLSLPEVPLSGLDLQSLNGPMKDLMNPVMG